MALKVYKCAWCGRTFRLIGPPARDDNNEPVCDACIEHYKDKLPS